MASTLCRMFGEVGYSGGRSRGGGVVRWGGGWGGWGGVVKTESIGQPNCSSTRTIFVLPLDFGITHDRGFLKRMQ